MREAIRGYAAATFEGLDDSAVADTSSDLSSFGRALDENPALLQNLGDDAVSSVVRAAIANDVLAAASGAARRLVSFVVRSDAASELASDVDWLVFRAEHEAERRQQGIDPDPPVGHTGVNERLQGYAFALFDAVQDDQTIDEVEDELFRMARLIEANRELDDTLTNFDLPASLREQIIVDLLRDQAEPITTALIRYAVRENRGQLVGHLEWLSERMADERGRRNATVDSAVPLEPEQQQRLTTALSALTGRRVSLQVRVDPDLLGGLRVVVGDTVLDGTVRRRLQQVGAVLVHGVRQNPGATERLS